MSPMVKAKGARGKADVLFSKIVRSRGACENCGRTEPEVQLQCAHIITRGIGATRCLEDNAFCLCAGCHHRFTHWPVEFRDFIVSKKGEDGYQRLVELARPGAKAPKWPEVVQQLKERWAQIEAEQEWDAAS